MVSRKRMSGEMVDAINERQASIILHLEIQVGGLRSDEVQ